MGPYFLRDSAMVRIVIELCARSVRELLRLPSVQAFKTKYMKWLNADGFEKPGPLYLPTVEGENGMEGYQ